MSKYLALLIQIGIKTEYICSSINGKIVHHIKMLKCLAETKRGVQNGRAASSGSAFDANQ